jgi:hypothetical protein
MKKIRLKCGEKYFQNVSLAKDSLNLVLFKLQNVEFEESYTVKRKILFCGFTVFD